MLDNEGIVNRQTAVCPH